MVEGLAYSNYRRLRESQAFEQPSAEHLLAGAEKIDRQKSARFPGI